MKRSFLFAVMVLLCLRAEGRDQTGDLLARAWPAAPYSNLESIGAGVGVVFTPDLSVRDNCRFFEALGFACFESADWLQILREVDAFNLEHPGFRIRTLILETHGTNGHGLKVQNGKKPEDDRSYISVAALQETLEPVGLRFLILSACNSGRLLRPEIYRRLNRNPGDKLFLPATLGIIDATDGFDERGNEVTVITPATSHIETTLVGSVRELAPATREALEGAAAKRGIQLPQQFAVSEMLIQMLLREPALQLRTGAHADELSKEQTAPDTSEQLFRSFVSFLDFAAARDASSRQTAGATGSH